jgi:hypothetical protein
MLIADILNHHLKEENSFQKWTLPSWVMSVLIQRAQYALSAPFSTMTAPTFAHHTGMCFGLVPFLTGIKTLLTFFHI